ncbi:MAG TPA: PEP-CTERM sorting domain-containing protein [Pirellulaceae bacterium]|nr:PEP-CTERM sorting domain-containing protein [Pirellulaceae bacterium]
MRNFLVGLIALVLTLPGIGAADVITQWTFNDPLNTGQGTDVPDIGLGTIDVVPGQTLIRDGFASGVGSSDPAVGSGTNRGHQNRNMPAQGTQEKLNGIQAFTSTAGYENITVSWDHRFSNTAIAHVQFQYSLDGLNFTDFGPLYVAPGGDQWLNGNFRDLSSIAGVNNNPNFAFRIVGAFNPSTGEYSQANGAAYNPVGTTGTWRFDMVTISGDPIAAIPEPSALAVLGLVALAGLARRRRS